MGQVDRKGFAALLLSEARETGIPLISQIDESPEDEDKGARSGIMGEWGREEGKERTKKS